MILVLIDFSYRQQDRSGKGDAQLLPKSLLCINSIQFTPPYKFSA